MLDILDTIKLLIFTETVTLYCLIIYLKYVGSYAVFGQGSFATVSNVPQYEKYFICISLI